MGQRTAEWSKTVDSGGGGVSGGGGGMDDGSGESGFRTVRSFMSGSIAAATATTRRRRRRMKRERNLGSGFGVIHRL